MDLQELFEELKAFHEGFIPSIKISKETEGVIEFSGTKEVMQGKKKVAGHYFSTIMLKPKDIRYYFIPIYCHVEAFNLSPDLQKMLKGKSCFHLKKLNPEILEELKAMIKHGVEMFQEKGTI